MAQILRGSEVVAALNNELSERIASLAAINIRPTLAIVRIHDSDGDIAYEQGLVRRAAQAGIQTRLCKLPETVLEEGLLDQIERLNNDTDVHGILVLQPLPASVSIKSLQRAIAPCKDVDGITPISLSGVFANEKIGFPPCTAEACVRILDHYHIPCAGKHAVVIGRSLVVGKPAAMMLLSRNATVTICHSKTPELAQIARKADILVAAAGRMSLVDDAYMRAGQTVVDVGIHFDADGRMCGDVLYDDALSVVDAITPVPGGVGTVTTSLMIAHTVEAAERIVEGSYGRTQK